MCASSSSSQNLGIALLISWSHPLPRVQVSFTISEEFNFRKNTHFPKVSPKNVTHRRTKRFCAGTRRVPLRDHFEDIFSPLYLANGWTVFRSEKCVGTGFARADPTHVSDQKTDEPFKRYKRNKTLKRAVGISHPTVWFSQKIQQHEKTVRSPSLSRRKLLPPTILVRLTTL